MRHYERSRNKEHDSIEREKQMNILILQGSPRANGNTAWMAEEYRRAAEAAGIVTAKNDEQKTDATRCRILELVGKL